MRCWQYLGIALLSACVTATFKSGGDHVDSAKDAYARGNYDEAEQQYAIALQRAEGDGAAWVRSEVDRGRALINIKRLHARIPVLRSNMQPTLASIKEVHEARDRLRYWGGDAAVDAELVGALGVLSERVMTALETRAVGGDVFAPAHQVQLLFATPDLPDKVHARGEVILATAAAVAKARADAEGTKHPLAQRLHMGHAATLGGAPVTDASAMLAPFVVGVDVAVTAPDGCAMSSLEQSLARSGTTRRASVKIDITSCTTSTNTSTSTQIATWPEQEFDHYETVYVTEQDCHSECGSIVTGNESCHTSYATSQPSLVCTKETITRCFDVCKPIQVPKQQPVYREVQRQANRTLTTIRSFADITGTWTITRDGKAQRGTIEIHAKNESSSAPAIGGAEPFVAGSRRTGDEIAAIEVKSTGSTIQRALDQLFAADIAAATEAARAAAGRIDDEEEAWVRAVVLGGEDLGPLAARYDLDRARLVGLFAAHTYAAPTPEVLSAVATFKVLPRRDTNTITRNDKEELATSLPTFGGGGRYWLQFDGSYRSLPIVAGASGQEIGGDEAMLLGVMAATRALSGRGKTPWGLQIADELGGGIGLGKRTGGPEIVDNAVGGFAGTVSLHYALGAGYRAPAKGALFGGVRAGYEAFLLGSATGSYSTFPLFVRAEAPLAFGTLSVEASGFALAGAAHWGLSIHGVNRRRWDDTPMKYFQLRIEHTNVDATSTDFGDASAMNGERMLEDVGLTSVHLMYGRGW
jgi:hypothetical protein